MKTSSKILLAALFGSALSLSAFAGPGIQYWQNHGANAAPSSDSAAVKPADTSGLKCATMLEPKVRVSRETSTTKVVTCTPDMLKSNPRCQQLCGN